MVLPKRKSLADRRPSFGSVGGADVADAGVAAGTAGATAADAAAAAEVEGCCDDEAPAVAATEDEATLPRVLLVD